MKKIDLNFFYINDIYILIYLKDTSLNIFYTRSFKLKSCQLITFVALVLHNHLNVDYYKSFFCIACKALTCCKLSLQANALLQGLIG